MRATRTLRAVAQSSVKFLEAGAPTGLTGLLTHASPRPALISIYNLTLQKLQQMPESSVYRQSTEALTRHRLSIVEAVQPEGHSAWQGRVQKSLEEHLHFQKAGLSDAEREAAVQRIVTNPFELESLGEGLKNLEPEPPLSAQQIGEIENKIGAGLIEEIIQVAEGERIVTETMVENKVWEELEEKPVEGQWTYHERDRHTPTTQAP
ncbi:hypothetical protein K461DRAFT_266348 [Myriangium duriaei CBS 260.36]|uniref:Uncharacterized protein n=1 Tax=Myriangium duriaei CBS 260.36 TaxID=1168546 RepID=A0A9P4J582_9PEZI|nr:hypothetical protein K461DRAFT_266348 [Myriangium duriaei CBS 260.36]